MWWHKQISLVPILSNRYLWLNLQHRSQDILFLGRLNFEILHANLDTDAFCNLKINLMQAQYEGCIGSLHICQWITFLQSSNIVSLLSLIRWCNVKVWMNQWFLYAAFLSFIFHWNLFLSKKDGQVRCTAKLLFTTTQKIVLHKIVQKSWLTYSHVIMFQPYCTDKPFRCVATLKVYLFRFNGIVSVEWLLTHSLKMQNQYA